MQPRALVAEFIGTAFLLAGVVGSGVVAEIERVVRTNGLSLTSRAAACV